MSTDEHVDQRLKPQQNSRSELQQVELARRSPPRYGVDPAWTYRALTVLDVFLHVFVASTFVIGIWRASYQLFVHYHTAMNPWLATGASVLVQLDGTGSWLYVLDSFFSVCIIGSLVVIVWRGVWSLMDEYIYPEDENTSAIMSLVIGYSVVLLAFALQPAVKKLVNKINGLKRILVVDVYLLFSFFGAVNVWRGVWVMLDNHFIPDAPITSYWVSHIACFGFLVLLNSSNSILVRGVYIDAEEDGTQCVDFPCYYVRLLVQKRKRKKQIRIDEEGKEMTQIKIEKEEKTEEINEKMLLTSENGDTTISNKTEETLNSSKIV